MSTLRPGLRLGSTLPCVSNGTGYLMILESVKARSGLIHGKLHDRGEYCAIGSYFDINGRTSLSAVLVDEVVAVNDSVPHISNRERKVYVARWLQWKLVQLGMPGFRKAKRRINL